jgi:hypothetical protein
MSYESSTARRRFARQARVENESIRVAVVGADGSQLGHLTAPIHPGDVHDEVDGQRNCLPNAVVRQADIRSQNTMRETRQGLLGRVRMNRAQTPEMPGVQRLQQIECLCPSHFPNEDAIRPMTERRPKKIGNRDRAQWRLLAERSLRTTRFQPKHIRFRKVNLGGFLDDDDAVATGNVRRESIEQRRFAGSGPS